MRIKATLLGESEFVKTIKQWEKLTGKGIEEGIEMVARASAKPLASTVQPWGLDDSSGTKFIANISKQVSQVWFGINMGYYELQGNLEQTYNSLRRKGVIRARKFRKQSGHPFRYLVSEQERDKLIAKQQAKAGRAKAAWIDAGVSVNRKRISGSIGRWISRHKGGGYGTATRLKSGLNTEIELHNRTPYLKHIQKDRDLETALKRGRKAGFSALNRAINYHLKKAQQ